MKPSINYDSIFLLPRTKSTYTGFSRWIWIHFPPISFVFKGKLCLAHQKLFFRNKHLIHIEHLVYNVNLYVCSTLVVYLLLFFGLYFSGGSPFNGSESNLFQQSRKEESCFKDFQSIGSFQKQK